MALARWTGVVQDAGGNAIAGALVEVRNEETNSLAPIFSDRAGLANLPNPFVAEEPTIGFHAAGGAYRILASVGGYEREWRYVAIGTAAETDIPDNSAGGPLDGLLLLEAADAKGTRITLASGGFADALASEAGIDTVASTNEVYDGIADSYSPAVSPDPAISQASGANIGDMTAASGLAGAFDGTPTTRAERAAGVLNGYVGKNFGGLPKRISKATVQGFTTGFDGSSAASNINISLYGKNGAPANGTDGTLLGTTTPFADPGTADIKTIASTDKVSQFSHVWAYITSSVAEPRIGELVLFEPGTMANMTIISNTVIAATEVEAVRAGVRVIENEAVVANTDFTLEVSRGTSWSPVVLTLVASMGAEKFYETLFQDISDDAPGGSMRVRFRTLNGKNVSLSGFTLLPRD